MNSYDANTFALECVEAIFAIMANRTVRQSPGDLQSRKYSCLVKFLGQVGESPAISDTVTSVERWLVSELAAVWEPDRYDIVMHAVALWKAHWRGEVIAIFQNPKTQVVALGLVLEMLERKVPNLPGPCSIEDTLKEMQVLRDQFSDISIESHRENIAFMARALLTQALFNVPVTDFYWGRCAPNVRLWSSVVLIGVVGRVAQKVVVSLPGVSLEALANEAWPLLSE